MVIFEKTSRFAFHLLHEAKSRVRISEGAYENNGNLQENAITRAKLALRDFLSIADSYHVRKTLCVATSAVRDAPNNTYFLKSIKDELGLSIKVIDGPKEALMGGIACANLLPKMQAVTVDIGGGSTEFAYLDCGRVDATYSLDLGTVRLKELFFDRMDMEGAVRYIDAELDKLPDHGSDTIIGIGGTFRALSRALMKRAEYPLQKTHGYSFTAQRLIDYGKQVMDADIKTLKRLGVKPDRFDVIKPGTLILLRVIERLAGKEMVTSGVGVREGVFLSDLLRNSAYRFPENYNPSMRYLMDRYIPEKRQVNNIAALTRTLFDLMREPFSLSETYREDLITAAKLSKIGASLHFYSFHQHSYYLTQTALEYGYSHAQVMLISTLLRFQKRKRPKKVHREAYDILLPDDRTLELLSFIIALADTLMSDYARTPTFKLSLKDNKIILVDQQGRELYLAKEALGSIDHPKGLSVKFID
jgi:exopolyphosphatase/guanosine-5'-triphosphate,3'-diphosphate pyrophosphatase